MSYEKIDRDKISRPRVHLTDEAINQINLIFENDPTVSNQSLRVEISGKGCHGFDYSVGFDSPREEDFQIDDKSLKTTLIIDPFSAFYLEHFSLDFLMDPHQDIEGFIVTNHEQNQFAGKFWKKKTEKIPPQKSS